MESVVRVILEDSIRRDIRPEVSVTTTVPDSSLKFIEDHSCVTESIFFHNNFPGEESLGKTDGFGNKNCFFNLILPDPRKNKNFFRRF